MDSSLTTPERNSPALCVLVIDDDDTILDLVTDILSVDYTVHLAHNGYEALEHLDHNLCDAMLVDLGMPGMNGLELIDRVRSNERTRHIPIIVMSAYHELRSQVENRDVQAIISKPFSLERFYKAVQTVLAGRSPSSSPATPG